jgi:hypothetical protein
VAVQPIAVAHSPCLGLYSKIARQDLVDARSSLPCAATHPSAEDIRRCRQELTSFGDDTTLKRATERLDFFSTSRCRDLLFHIQETQIDASRDQRISKSKPAKISRPHPAGSHAAEFSKATPGDKAMTNLDHWHSFKTENPMIFAGMYQFWIQKT